MAVKKISFWSRLNSWLHLWLGLVSGLIVFIVALTGTMFVFCDDIIDALAGKALHAKEIRETRLPPEELLKKFREQVPGQRAFYFVSYKDPARSFKIGSSGKDRKMQFTWLDPYTGKVLGSGRAYYFFYVVAHVHSGEMPFGKTGGLIVQIATWIFLIELITGLILWWPAKWTKATRKQSFTVKLKGSFKRVNYDLHNVPGFYSLLPALMLTVTGLIIVNETVKKGLHASLGGNTEAYFEAQKFKPAYDSTKKFASLQTLTDQLYAAGDHIQQVRMTIPATDSITSFYALAAKDIGLKGVEGGSLFSVNRYTGEKISLPRNIVKGLEIDGMVMNLHIGFWGGTWGKILTFIIGLICMTLPITGFLIWLGRKNKKTKKRMNEKTTAAARIAAANA